MSIIHDFEKKYGSCSKKMADGGRAGEGEREKGQILKAGGSAARGMTSKFHMAEGGGTPSFISTAKMKKGGRSSRSK